MYHILIVDDEKAIREQLPLAFEWEQYGFEVVGTAANGKAACQQVESLKPELILLDIRMPIMDGLEFLKWLRVSPFKDTQVLLLTGYSEFEYAVTAMRYGARGYLTKPLDEDEIADYLIEISTELNARLGLDSCDTDSSNLCDKVCDYIDAHFAEQLTVNNVAAHFFVSPSHLGQTFRRGKGSTFRQYLKDVRIRRAQQLLECTNLHIYDIAHRVGFSESKYFVVCFEQSVGMSPVNYRRAKTGRE
jgi:two-component system, response regulator YesN